MTDEQWARLFIGSNGIFHQVGGAIATAFGAGAIVPIAGKLEDAAIDSFIKKASPGPALNENARNVLREEKALARMSNNDKLALTVLVNKDQAGTER